MKNWEKKALAVLKRRQKNDSGEEYKFALSQLKIGLRVVYNAQRIKLCTMRRGSNRRQLDSKTKKVPSLSPSRGILTNKRVPKPSMLPPAVEGKGFGGGALSDLRVFDLLQK